MATRLPHVTFNTQSFAQLNPMLSTNAQATNQALRECVTGHRVAISRYAASGTTTNRITLWSASPQTSLPWAVLLVRVRETSDPAKDLSVTPRLNYAQDGTTLYVYEPAGLTANTLYDMDFLVLE